MRVVVKAGFLILGLAACDIAGSQNNSPELLRVERVAGNVYSLGDGSSESAVLVSDEGILLVDARWADPQPVLEALQAIADKPITFVVNTHCHADHNRGNVAFQDAGATIVAHKNVRERMSQEKCDGPALPDLTFDSELVLHFGNEEVQIIALPTGHTDGDAVVYFRNANVLATGDAFISSELPFYSKYAGGNMLGVNEQLRRITEQFPDDVRIISGHGPLSLMSDVRKALQVLDEVRDAIAEQFADGKTLDELKSMNLLDRWKESLGEYYSEYLQMYYDSLGPPDPAFQL